MRHRITLALLMAGAALLTGLSACSHSARLAPQAPQIDLPDLASVGLVPAWQRRVRLVDTERVANAWRVGAAIFVASSEGRVTMIDARSGEQRWDLGGVGMGTAPIFRPAEVRTSGTTRDSQLSALVVTQGKAYLIDSQSGVIHKDGSLGISATTDPIIMGNTLCVGSADAFYGLYLDTLGGVRWRVADPGDFFVARPAVADSDIIIASRHGNLRRISSQTGIPVWRDRKTNGDVVAPLMADSRAVYVPSLDQRVYAFDVQTGTELWESQLEGTLDQPATSAAELLLVPATGRGLFALQRNNGVRRWYAPGVTSVATVMEKTAWVGDSAGILSSVNLENGQVLASAPVPGVAKFLRNTSQDNLVIVINSSGLIGAYAPK